MKWLQSWKSKLRNWSRKREKARKCGRTKSGRLRPNCSWSGARRKGSCWSCAKKRNSWNWTKYGYGSWGSWWNKTSLRSTPAKHKIWTCPNSATAGTSGTSRNDCIFTHSISNESISSLEAYSHSWARVRLTSIFRDLLTTCSFITRRNISAPLLCRLFAHYFVSLSFSLSLS